MSNSILIAGFSSTGKSTSIRNLPVDNTLIIQSIAKALPFKAGGRYTKEKKNLAVTDNTKQILSTLNWASQQEHIKYVILDDTQYILANEYFRRAQEKGFDKFTQMGQNFHGIVHAAQNLRDDQFVFFMHHTDLDVNGNIKVKTIGKMLDDQMCVEGFFSIVLHSVRADNDYSFVTNGYGIAKSPFEMLPQQMPNDLMSVVSAINEYYKVDEPEETETEEEGGE